MSITAFPAPTRSVVRDKDSVRRWFERLGRVLPTLRITVNKVTVKGWPWNTQVFAEWDGNATLNNEDPYINRGLHVFTLRWGRVYALKGIPGFTGGGQWSCDTGGYWPQGSVRGTHFELGRAYRPKQAPP